MVDELAGSVLDLRETDRFVEGLGEVRQVKELENDSFPVDSHETMTEFGDGGTTLEFCVGEDASFDQTHFGVSLASLTPSFVVIAIFVDVRTTPKKTTRNSS